MRWLIGSATECSLFEVCVLKLLLVSCDGVDLITSLDTIWMLCEQVLKLAEFASVIAFVERSHIEEAYICINNFKINCQLSNSNSEKKSTNYLDFYLYGKTLLVGFVCPAIMRMSPCS